MRYYGKDYWRIAKLLRQNVPLSVPVVIRTVPSAVLTKVHGTPCYGDCEPIESQGAISYYRIRMARGLSLAAWQDALIHEMAHALDCDRYGYAARDCHRASWGECFAVCYKAVVG